MRNVTWRRLGSIFGPLEVVLFTVVDNIVVAMVVAVAVLLTVIEVGFMFSALTFPVSTALTRSFLICSAVGCVAVEPKTSCVEVTTDPALNDRTSSLMKAAYFFL